MNQMTECGRLPTCVAMANVYQGDVWRASLPHFHEKPMIFWLSRGEGRIVLDGRRYGLASDTVCVAPAGTLMMLDVSPRALGSILILDENDAPDTARVFQPIATDVLAQIAGGISGHQVLNWLREQKAPSTIRADRAGDRLIRALSQLVIQSCPAQFSMADHAATLGVTPTHLTRVCRDALGQSAADLMTGRVVHAARTALIDTAKPIKNIAFDLGFSSAAYFTRFVQKHTGKTPSRLRKSGT